MSSWYVLSALGLYPLSPASATFHFSPPLFGRVEVRLATNATLVIAAANQAPGNARILGVTWNGAPVAGVSVAYADLMRGGVLEFTMGPSSSSPSSRARTEAAVAGAPAGLRGARASRRA